MGANSESDSNVDIGALRRHVDIRLCTIAGILCSLNLIDSGILSSAAVTTMLSDLDLKGDRFSVSILLFAIASVCFQLPATRCEDSRFPYFLHAEYVFLRSDYTMHGLCSHV